LLRTRGMRKEKTSRRKVNVHAVLRGAVSNSVIDLLWLAPNPPHIGVFKIDLCGEYLD
jgi:hypothetical protein